MACVYLLLPENLVRFQWNRRAGMIRRHPGREVVNVTRCCDARGKNEAAISECDASVHGFAFWLSAILAAGE